MNTSGSAVPVKGRLARKFRAYFFTGLLVLVPLGLTYSIIKLLFLAIDDILSDSVSKFILAKFGFEIDQQQVPGIGIVTLLLIIFVTGVIARNYLGKKLVDFGDQIVQRIPLINRVYLAMKQISQAFFSSRSEVIKKPVLFEFPRKGMYSIGFYTQDVHWPLRNSVKQDLAAIFMPTTPNPTTGFLIFLPKSELMEIDLSVEEALKLVISGGIISPMDKSDPKTESKSPNPPAVLM